MARRLREDDDLSRGRRLSSGPEMKFRLTPLLAAKAALLFIAAAPAAAQTACQIARAELAAFDRSSAASGGGELSRWIAYYRSIGCDAGATPMFARPPNCRQVEAQIARLQAGGGGMSDARRRGALVADVETQCNTSALSATSRNFEPNDSGSRVVIDDQDQRSAMEPPKPAGLGRAMCVRSCDGFYFPLQSSPGGREGADEMCQALCPASQTHAFFLDNGSSMDAATDSQGVRYASLPRAYQFRRTISATCGCKRPGETWSTTLRRADEINGPQNGEMVVGPDGKAPEEKVDLRPSSGPVARAVPRRRLQAIDPEPLPENPELEPEYLPPEPKGLVTMTPIKPAPRKDEPPAATQALPPRGPVRTVGPNVHVEKNLPRASD
ncbi:DUF2865 domain-containing protein [Terrarubrum flagellatum]|uniref:DUF2865 domain-containing protein n=1 Tax=Terrirubrum flagellatum TaxID=2895980 RepID=UPI003144E9B3